MHFPTAFYLLSLLLSSTALANPTPALEKRLTRSKLDQFTTTVCDGNSGDSGSVGDKGSFKNEHSVDIPAGDCIDIDGRTNSIYLAKGRGLAYRRKMFAYQATGCPADKKIERITDRDPAGPCINVNSALLNTPGSDLNAGRIMSVMFVSF